MRSLPFAYPDTILSNGSIHSGEQPSIATIVHVCASMVRNPIVFDTSHRYLRGL